MNRLKVVLPIAIVCAGLLLSACTAPADTSNVSAATEAVSTVPASTAGSLTVEGSLMPVRSTVLGFASSGKLGEILVNEGQEVKAGDVLARMDGLETLQAALTQAQLEQLAAQQALDDLNSSADLLKTQSTQALLVAQQALSDAQKALKDLDTDQFEDELDYRNDLLDDAKETLDDAQEKLDDTLDLDPENYTRKTAQDEYDDAADDYEDALYNRDTWQNRLDQAKAAVDVAQAQLDDAQAFYNAHQNGPDPDELALAQARLDNANAQVTAAQTALDNTELTAPYDATVVDVSELETGELVTAGTAVVVIADYSQWIVETTDLSELDVVEVEAGQQASVVPDALPDLEMAGIVASVDRLYSENRGDIVYTVRIILNQADPRLRWGMTTTVTFE